MGHSFSSKERLLISWLQSPYEVIWGSKKIKSVTVSIVSPSNCHEVTGPDGTICHEMMGPDDNP